MMISRSSLGRNAQLVTRKQCCASPSNRRGLAAAASGTFQYETGDAAGVKFATRDLAGPTTTLAVVAKAGTRYQILPGFSDGLEKFAFKVRWLHDLLEFYGEDLALSTKAKLTDVSAFLGHAQAVRIAHHPRSGAPGR